ncbi:MAG: hypothetical protein JJT94_10505 [Bernardetiaceae bacterium]|nr:hypothetical protein [Bernardetiaceae bacterium]
MKVFLLEDDFHYCKHIKKVLGRLCCEIMHIYQDTQEEGIIEAALSSDIDLYLLDIEIMGQQTAGLEFAKRLRKAQTEHKILYQGHIVYLSGHQVFDNAYRSDYPTPADYLYKPTSSEQLYRTLRECITKIKSRQKYFYINARRYLIDDILYIDTIPEQKLCKVHLKQGNFLITTCTLSDFIDAKRESRAYAYGKLSKVNKSLLVNLDNVVRVRKSPTNRATRLFFSEDTDSTHYVDTSVILGKPIRDYFSR